ncbi:MAG: hypothetical protein HOP18_00230 [Deltaproteobacteria bacterium]|nr:hypothetical protein [Deltaproteobacteria bacterium]
MNHTQGCTLVMITRFISLLTVVQLTMVAGVTAGEQWSDWGKGVPVTEIKTIAGEGCTIESPNGKELYVASNRTGTLGANDIWVAKRKNRKSPWGELRNVGEPVNSAAADFCPTPLPGKWLFFVSERPGDNTCNAGPGKGDIYLTRGSFDHGWTPPQHLGCREKGTGPNSNGAELSPSLVETKDGTFLFFSSDFDGDQDLYVSVINKDGSFGPPKRIDELSSDSIDVYANVTKNGREIVFSSNRPGGAGGLDVWYSSRDSVLDSWSPPVNLGTNINTENPETRPTFSWDHKRLYFGRTISGNGNSYVSTRTKVDD